MLALLFALTPPEDAVLRPVVAQWNARRIDRSAPLVVAPVSLQYAAAIEPELRLELLRRGVEMNTAEALIASLCERNAKPEAIVAPSLAGATRIPADSNDLEAARLPNFSFAVSVAVPGTAGDLGVVVYGYGPKPYRDSHVAFVRGGRLEWEHEFSGASYAEANLSRPKFAELTADGAAIVRALLDAHFPDRAAPLLLVNEADALFLPRPELGRPITMVMHERLATADLGGAAAAVQVSLPAMIGGDTATISYVEVVPPGQRRGGTATLKRSESGWTVAGDDRTIPDPRLKDVPPLRVGGDVKPPHIVKRVRPQFPEGTRQLIVEVVVGTDGRIKDIQFLTGGSAEVQRLAREALAQWEMEPGTLNGTPVPTIWNLTLP